MDPAVYHSQLGLAACALWPALAPYDARTQPDTLRSLLLGLPPGDVVRGLLLASEGDKEREAYLLISLANPAYQQRAEAHWLALRAEAHEVATALVGERPSDDVTLDLVRSLAAYDVPRDDTELLLVRALVARGRLEEAEALLGPLCDRNPSADALYLYAQVTQALARDPEQVLNAYVRFLAYDPSDARAGVAWREVGDVYATTGHGMEAVAAYERADAAGETVPALEAYRAGQWDAIPALRNHPDYPFPVVVAVDLEVDPAPGAAPGERVYEVGAVRVKGGTTLASFQSFVRRPFRPAKGVPQGLLEDAPSEAAVARSLLAFIGDSLVVGHNLMEFDAVHLCGMGVALATERMLDTMQIARLLYPDSIQHSLDTMCQAHQIAIAQSDRHTALPDAQACAALLYALGGELAGRGDHFVAGVRALARPGGALDRAVLAPRCIAADPSLPWQLDPSPALPRVLSARICAGAGSNWDQGRDEQRVPSAALLEAMASGGDALAEIADPVAAYAAHIPEGQRCVLAVGSRARLERVLAARHGSDDTYALADPRTLLCPASLRDLIDRTEDPDTRLLLFCLYQASHNHDASALYPLRIPSNDPHLSELRAALLSAVCSQDPAHRVVCAGCQAASEAAARYGVLVATHQVLLAQPTSPRADLAIIDDVDALPTGLARWAAARVRRDDLTALGPQGAAALRSLDRTIGLFAEEYAPHPGYRERLPLQSLLRHATAFEDASGDSALVDPPSTVEDALALLKASGPAAASLAFRLEELCNPAQREPDDASLVHAYWIDLLYSEEQGGEQSPGVATWEVAGVSVDPQALFSAVYWRPYAWHVVCGPAISLAGSTQFLEDALGIPAGLPKYRDHRPLAPLLLPTPEVVPPSTFMNRRRWALAAGALLEGHVLGADDRILVAIDSVPASAAFASTFRRLKGMFQRQVLSPSLGWSIAKIGQRLNSPAASRTLTVVPPRVRREMLNGPVDLEVTGPLRFANQRDPLVAAHMRVFARRFPARGPFSSYLLPQALLELKSRLSSPARVHLVLDGGLLSKTYRDEALEALRDCADVRVIDRILEPSDGPTREVGAAGKEGRRSVDLFSVLGEELAARGLAAHEDASDTELRTVLRALWDTGSFLPFPESGPCLEEDVSQADVVRGVLEKRDQLLVAATGGGKSLCYQLPAVLLAEETPPKLTLVFSPLIALMRNQVDDLNRRGVFTAIILNSTLSPAEREEHLRGIRRGEYSIVYLAPEQIHSASLRRAVEGREIGLIAVDEAHCLSQWGHDFRTDYFALRKWIKKRLNTGGERDFPILALTATARPTYKDKDPAGELTDKASTVDDITGKLDLHQDVRIVQSSTHRDGLSFRVLHVTPGGLVCHKCGAPLPARSGLMRCERCNTRQQVTDEALNGAVNSAKLDRALSLLDRDGQDGFRSRWDNDYGQRQRGLIYCAYRRTTEEVAAALEERVRGLRVACYHAGLGAVERDEVLRRFTNDGEEGLDVVVATNAFGMGIDVRRLGFVLHFDVPGTLEAYYQEAGRAGRDQLFDRENPAICMLLYHPSDLLKQRILSRGNVVTQYEIQDVYEALLRLGHAGRETGGGSGDDQEIPNGSTQEARDPNDGPDQGLEVLATDRDIALLAGVDDGDDGRGNRIATILYYLEYHTQAHDRPVLEREETANHVWRLRFEEGYEERIAALPEHSPSRPLLDLFLKSESYGLNSYSSTPVSLGELKDSLGWSYARLESEILNLVRRQIITYTTGGRLRWAAGAERARADLYALRGEVAKLLTDVDSTQGGALRADRTVYVDLRQYDWGATPLPRLTRFLFALSQEAAEPLRVFQHFKRALRYAQPARYEFRLWQDREGRAIVEIVNELFRELRDTLARLEKAGVRAEWQPFDVLQVEADYERRQRFSRYLVLFDLLGIINYIADPAMGMALRLRLLQPDAGVDDLQIDLQSLRLKETYAKHKLKLMERYAALGTEGERAQEFETYFRAEQPIVEPIDENMRADLTPPQAEVVRLNGGYHLIEGPAGCGKTTALVEHIKHLVYRCGVPLDRIMVTTYFNAAVGRIERQLETMREDGSASLSSTINGFGYKVFSKYRHLLRTPDNTPLYTREPTILKPRGREFTTQKQEEPLISRALAMVHSGEWPRDGWPEGLQLPSLRRRYRPSSATEELCWRAIKRLREYGVYPGCRPDASQIREAVAESPDGGAMRQWADAEYDTSALYAVYCTYLQLMGREGYLTYDDQVLFALAILTTNEDVAREYRRFFEHVMVDELQDFTPAAAALFSVLSGLHHNVVAFGDPDQAIRVMTTRSADVFDKLRCEDGCGGLHPHRLSTNFRSTQEIVDLALWVRNFREDQANQLQVVAARGRSGERPTLVRVKARQEPPETAGLEDLVDAALAHINRLPDMGSAAMIVPISSWRHKVESVLRSRGVTFSIMSSQSLYQQPHVDNVLVYHRLIADPRSDDDAAHLLRHCLVPYIESRQIKTMREVASSEGRSLLDVLGDEEVLQHARVTDEQRAVLDIHLGLLRAFTPDSRAGDLEKALRALENNPVNEVESQPEKVRDIKEVLSELAAQTVRGVVEQVKGHVAFLEAHRGDVGLVLTSIDDAKSEEFDAVAFIGPNHLPDNRKLRWYVSLSRARDGLVLVCDEQRNGWRGLMRAMPPYLYREARWPEPVRETASRPVTASAGAGAVGMGGWDTGAEEDDDILF